MTNDSRDTLVPGADPDPASPHHATVKSSQDARAGFMLGHVRWVLAISFIAAMIALVIAWFAIRG